MNVLSNAIDVLEGYIRQQIAEPLDDKQDFRPKIRLHTYVVCDPWIAISIADKGLGIPEEFATAVQGLLMLKQKGNYNLSGLHC